MQNAFFMDFHDYFKDNLMENELESIKRQKQFNLHGNSFQITIKN